MAYGEDLAWIHDAGFAGFAEAAAPAVIQRLQEAGHTHGRVVELGCGSGQLAKSLSDAGYDVLGVDISEAMVRHARRRVPRARFVTGSFLDVQIPACCAVVAVGEVLCYLLDEQHNVRRLSALFRRVWRALPPGGLFLFDALGPGHVRPGGERRHRVERDWATLVEVAEDSRHQVLTRHITTFRRVGQHYRRDEEIHRQRLFSPADLATSLRRIGFRVRVRRGYGSERFGGNHYAVLARRP